jgi:hypothetical protein
MNGMFKRPFADCITIDLGNSHHANKTRVRPSFRYRASSRGAVGPALPAEIASLLTRLRDVKAAQEIAHQLSEVFGGHLGYSSLGVDECSTVAADIFIRLKTAGLLDS